MDTTTRLLVAAALVAVTCGGVYLIRATGVPTEVRPPKQDMGKLPVRLGPWIGEELPPNPETFPDAGAEDSVARIYRNPAGEMVSVYAAVWLEYHIRTPHLPTACYGGSGHRIITENRSQLQAADQSSVPVRHLLLERDGQQVCVLYWYQLGDRVFFDSYGQREALWTLRHKDSRPPLIKVMIEAPASDPEQARAQLESIAAPLLAWTREL